MPPAAVEDLQQGGRDAEESHDDAGDAKVGDVHVARVAVLLAACEFKIGLNICWNRSRGRDLFLRREEEIPSIKSDYIERLLSVDHIARSNDGGSQIPPPLPPHSSFFLSWKKAPQTVSPLPSKTEWEKNSEKY